MDPEQGTIGILDLGTEKQKSKLYHFEELVAAAAPIVLEPTGPDKWKVWPKRNQNGSNTCVFQARAKAAGILREDTSGKFVEYSADDYNLRSNAPAAGAYPIEAFDLWRDRGIGLEVLEPSQNMSDIQILSIRQNSFDKKIAQMSSLENYVALPAYDFDIFISTLAATKKPIPLGFFATMEEWNRDIPKVLNPSLTLGSASVRHEVCATRNYGIWQGLDGFTIEDSWGSAGINGSGVRFISREFFSKRNYIPGLYPTTFKTFIDIGVDPTKPHAQFNRDLEFGMTGPDVRLLQEVYKYEGFFPANHPGSDIFHNVTLDCTKKFQVKYGIVGPGMPGYGRVGPLTRSKLNSLYS